MRHIVKKLISVVLTFAIVLGTVAICNFDLLNVKSYAENLPSGGQCGEKAYWTFDGSKLVVGGTGEMYEYDPTGYLVGIPEGENCVPWRDFREKVKTIEVGNGITNITDWAFEGLENLLSVNISETVSVIGREAFANCSKLSDVNLNDGLKEIGPWTFMDCTSLESIEFPKSLKSIGRQAFGESGLKYVEIPNTLEKIGRDAFAGCEKLENVVLPDNISSLSRGVFACCTMIKRIDLPESLKGISRETFNGCTRLEEICIPDSVESIGMAAFCDCTNLNSIRMSKNITYIDEAAFDNTGYYNNKSNWENGALYIDEYLIKANNVSENYYIKTGTKSVARHAFECSDSLTSVIVPASVNSFSYNPFYECSNLNKVVFLGRKTEFNDVFSSNETELTFYCFSDSDAYNYAQEKEIKCVSMDGLKTGDATGDRVINSSDALKVLQFAVGQNTEINEKYPVMDVNMDESVNSSDALAILQYSVGVIDRFKCSSVNNTDEDILCDMMRHMIYYHGLFKENIYKNVSDVRIDYCCDSEDAFEKSMDFMVSHAENSIPDLFTDIYRTKSIYCECGTESDPRHLFDTLYLKYDAEEFDKILENVFNVKSDHNYTMTWDYNGLPVLYYDNGYYYVKHAQFDMRDYGAEGLEVECRKNNDGSYYCYGSTPIIDGLFSDFHYNVKAQLINLDGNRIWSFESVEKMDLGEK